MPLHYASPFKQTTEDIRSHFPIAMPNLISCKPASTSSDTDLITSAKRQCTPLTHTPRPISMGSEIKRHPAYSSRRSMYESVEATRPQSPRSLATICPVPIPVGCINEVLCIPPQRKSVETQTSPPSCKRHSR